MGRNPILPYNQKLKLIARKLRKNMTYCEILLWQQIRRKRLGYQFHRQVPIKNYVVDFYCHELLLAVEVDGSSHDHPDIGELDLKRQKEIEDLEVQFLRFDDHDILTDMDGVLRTIKAWIELNT